MFGKGLRSNPWNLTRVIPAEGTEIDAPGTLLPVGVARLPLPPVDQRFLGEERDMTGIVLAALLAGGRSGSRRTTRGAASSRTPRPEHRSRRAWSCSASDRKVAAEADGTFRIDLPVRRRNPRLLASPATTSSRRASRHRLAPIEALLQPTVSLTDRVEVTATRAREGVDAATFTNIPPNA